MFGSLSTIDPKLQDYVSRIESSFVSERVRGAAVFKIPAVKACVRLRVTRSSRLTILEEFILRAAVDLEKPPTKSELAQALALDSVFIDAECENLGCLGVIDDSCLPEIVPTDSGRKFYEKGQVPRPAREEKWAAFMDCHTEKIFFKKAVDDAETDDRTDRYAPLPIPYDATIRVDTARLQSKFDIETVRKGLEAAGVYRPEDGYEVSEIISVDDPDFLRIIHRLVGVLAVYDVLKERLFFRVVDLESEEFYTEIENKLQDGIEPERKVTGDNGSSPGEQVLFTMGVVQQTPPQDLAVEPSERVQYISNIEERIRQRLEEEQAVSTAEIKQERKPGGPEEQVEQPRIPIVEWLTDAAIRPRFLQTITGAEQDIVIISPWVTNDVMDDDFLQLLQRLAKKRVLTVMGWGFKPRMDEEEKKPSEGLAKRLRKIKTPEKAPAVGLVWVGNQHRKEVIVDRRVHLCGSHNWLSYRGDWNIRGESVYYIEDREIIKPAAKHNAGLLVKALDREWKRYLKQRSDREVLSLCAMGWSTLNKELAGIKGARDLLGDGSGDNHDAVELLTLMCRCLHGRALSSGKDSLNEFWAELNKTIEEFGLCKGTASKQRQLKESVRNLGSEIGATS
jgi:hypothetical protein